MVVNNYNPITQEAKAGGFGVQNLHEPFHWKWLSLFGHAYHTSIHLPFLNKRLVSTNYFYKVTYSMLLQGQQLLNTLRNDCKKKKRGKILS